MNKKGLISELRRSNGLSTAESKKVCEYQKYLPSGWSVSKVFVGYGDQPLNAGNTTFGSFFTKRSVIGAYSGC
jgi:hypothetical protein